MNVLLPPRVPGTQVIGYHADFPSLLSVHEAVHVGEAELPTVVRKFVNPHQTVLMNHRLGFDQ